MYVFFKEKLTFKQKDGIVYAHISEVWDLFIFLLLFMLIPYKIKVIWWIGGDNKMKKTLIFVCFFILIACSKPDLTADNSETEEDIYESDLGHYVEGVSYKLSDQTEKDNHDNYLVDIIVRVKDSFNAVESKEKLSEMGSLYKNYLESDYINCGSPYCKAGRLVFITSTNEYAVYNDYEVSSTSWPLVLETDGEISFTWEQLREENRKIAEQKEKEKQENEPKTNGVSNEIIYLYMKAAYDDLTNNGENYVPETHDPMIEKLAAKRFGITQEQAAKIYIEKEMGQQ